MLSGSKKRHFALPLDNLSNSLSQIIDSGHAATASVDGPTESLPGSSRSGEAANHSAQPVPAIVAAGGATAGFAWEEFFGAAFAIPKLAAPTAMPCLTSLYGAVAAAPARPRSRRFSSAGILTSTPAGWRHISSTSRHFGTSSMRSWRGTFDLGDPVRTRIGAPIDVPKSRARDDDLVSRFSAVVDQHKTSCDSPGFRL